MRVRGLTRQPTGVLPQKFWHGLSMSASRGKFLDAALTDQLIRGGDGARAPVRDAIIFSRNNANDPRAGHATWMLTLMIRWGQVRAPFDIAAIARAVYRADIFCDARDGSGTVAGDQSGEGTATCFSGGSFDPGHPVAYLQGLAVRDRSVDLVGFRRTTS